MKIRSIIMAAALLLMPGCTEKKADQPTLLTEEIIMSENSGENIKKTAKAFKHLDEGNPISGQIFCADPTAVEYGGRLYVYGTNDQQQFDEVGPDGQNTYEKIRSLVVFSTADMVNWTYNGTIDVGSIAPWIYASWAPSVVSRVEDDGKTHFYLYFSNSGAGVGVITSTDPVAGWTDPLGKPLISSDTQGLGDCPNPFDPGVVIDDDGCGWLSFGAGISSSGNDYMTGAARIVKLGDDMISLGSEIAKIPDFYHFEASELNYVNDTYIYTYNTSWSERTVWEEDTDPPSACSMAYMTTKTPLDPESWEYRGHYFLNPGECGESYSNNHTHIHEFKGKWYILYHTLALQGEAGIPGGFRSMSVGELDMNEKTLEIGLTGASRDIPKQIENFDPYIAHLGTEMFTGAKIGFTGTDGGIMAISEAEGAWICVKSAKMSGGKRFLAKLSGSGRVELRLGSPGGETVAAIDFETDEPRVYAADMTGKTSGREDLFIVFSGGGIALGSWQLEK